MAGKGSGKLKDLCEAINKLEYDEVVKHDLMEQLTKWPQTKGFRLQKPNKEILRLLLEAFLSNDISVTKQVNNLESDSSPGYINLTLQVNQVLSACISLEDESWVSTQDHFGKSDLATLIMHN